MELEGIMLSTIRQKDKYHMISLTWNLRRGGKTKEDKNREAIRKRFLTLGNTLEVAGREVGGGMR